MKKRVKIISAVCTVALSLTILSGCGDNGSKTNPADSVTNSSITNSSSSKTSTTVGSDSSTSDSTSTDDDNIPRTSSGDKYTDVKGSDFQRLDVTEQVEFANQQAKVIADGVQQWLDSGVTVKAEDGKDYAVFYYQNNCVWRYWKYFGLNGKDFSPISESFDKTLARYTDGQAAVYISPDGKVIGCTYKIAGDNEAAFYTPTVPSYADYKAGSFKWSGTVDSTHGDGTVVGTYPVLSSAGASEHTLTYEELSNEDRVTWLNEKAKAMTDALDARLKAIHAKVNPNCLEDLSTNGTFWLCVGAKLEDNGERMLFANSNACIDYSEDEHSNTTNCSLDYPVKKDLCAIIPENYIGIAYFYLDKDLNIIGCVCNFEDAPFLFGANQREGLRNIIRDTDFDNDTPFIAKNYDWVGASGMVKNGYAFGTYPVLPDSSCPDVPTN